MRRPGDPDDSDRPERRNALTSEGLDALEAAVETASEPIVLLQGAGEAFADLVAGGAPRRKD